MANELARRLAATSAPASVALVREIVRGLFVAFGLLTLTRAAAIPLIIDMLGSSFHALVGGGARSLDARWSAKRS